MPYRHPLDVCGAVVIGMGEEEEEEEEEEESTDKDDVAPPSSSPKTVIPAGMTGGTAEAATTVDIVKVVLLGAGRAVRGRCGRDRPSTRPRWSCAPMESMGVSAVVE